MNRALPQTLSVRAGEYVLMWSASRNGVGSSPRQTGLSTELPEAKPVHRSCRRRGSRSQEGRGCSTA